MQFKIGCTIHQVRSRVDSSTVPRSVYNRGVWHGNRVRRRNDEQPCGTDEWSVKRRKIIRLRSLSTALRIRRSPCERLRVLVNCRHFTAIPSNSTTINSGRGSESTPANAFLLRCRHGIGNLLEIRQSCQRLRVWLAEKSVHSLILQSTVLREWPSNRCGSARAIPAASAPPPGLCGILLLPPERAEN